MYNDQELHALEKHCFDPTQPPPPGWEIIFNSADIRLSADLNGLYNALRFLFPGVAPVIPTSYTQLSVPLGTFSGVQVVGYNKTGTNVYVAAHAGTDLSNKRRLFPNVISDAQIATGILPFCWEETEVAVNEFRATLAKRGLNPSDIVIIHTGESLGALMAEKSVAKAQNGEIAIVFESTGSRPFLTPDEYDYLKAHSTVYLSLTNIINTRHEQVGNAFSAISRTTERTLSAECSKIFAPMLSDFIPTGWPYSGYASNALQRFLKFGLFTTHYSNNFADNFDANGKFIRLIPWTPGTKLFTLPEEPVFAPARFYKFLQSDVFKPNPMATVARDPASASIILARCELAASELKGRQVNNVTLARMAEQINLTRNTPLSSSEKVKLMGHFISTQIQHPNQTSQVNGLELYTGLTRLMDNPANLSEMEYAQLKFALHPFYVHLLTDETAVALLDQVNASNNIFANNDGDTINWQSLQLLGLVQYAKDNQQDQSLLTEMLLPEVLVKAEEDVTNPDYDLDTELQTQRFYFTAITTLTTFALSAFPETKQYANDFSYYSNKSFDIYAISRKIAESIAKGATAAVTGTLFLQAAVIICDVIQHIFTVNEKQRLQNENQQLQYALNDLNKKVDLITEHLHKLDKAVNSLYDNINQIYIALNSLITEFQRYQIVNQHRLSTLESVIYSLRGRSLALVRAKAVNFREIPTPYNATHQHIHDSYLLEIDHTMGMLERANVPPNDKLNQDHILLDRLSNALSLEQVFIVCSELVKATSPTLMPTASHPFVEPDFWSKAVDLYLFLRLNCPSLCSDTSLQVGKHLYAIGADVTRTITTLADVDVMKAVESDYNVKARAIIAELISLLSGTIENSLFFSDPLKAQQNHYLFDGWQHGYDVKFTCVAMCANITKENATIFPGTGNPTREIRLGNLHYLKNASASYVKESEKPFHVLKGTRLSKDQFYLYHAEGIYLCSNSTHSDVGIPTALHDTLTALGLIKIWPLVACREISYLEEGYYAQAVSSCEITFPQLGGDKITYYQVKYECQNSIVDGKLITEEFVIHYYFDWGDLAKRHNLLSRFGVPETLDLSNEIDAKGQTYPRLPDNYATITFFDFLNLYLRYYLAERKQKVITHFTSQISAEAQSRIIHLKAVRTALTLLHFINRMIGQQQTLLVELDVFRLFSIMAVTQAEAIDRHIIAIFSNCYRLVTIAAGSFSSGTLSKITYDLSPSDLSSFMLDTTDGLSFAGKLNQLLDKELAALMAQYDTSYKIHQNFSLIGITPRLDALRQVLATDRLALSAKGDHYYSLSNYPLLQRWLLSVDWRDLSETMVNVIVATSYSSQSPTLSLQSLASASMMGLVSWSYNTMKMFRYTCTFTDQIDLIAPIDHTTILVIVNNSAHIKNMRSGINEKVIDLKKIIGNSTDVAMEIVQANSAFALLSVFSNSTKTIYAIKIDYELAAARLISKYQTAKSKLVTEKQGQVRLGFYTGHNRHIIIIGKHQKICAEKNETQTESYIVAHPGKITAVLCAYPELITGGEEGSLCVWSLPGLAKKASLVHHEHAVFCIKSLSSDRIISTDNAGEIVVWNLQDNSAEHVFYANNKVIAIEAISDYHFVTLTDQGQLQIWDIVSQQEVYTINLKQSYTTVRTSISGNSDLFIASDDKLQLFKLPAHFGAMSKKHQSLRKFLP